MMMSIRARVIGAATLALIAFLGLTALALDKAFQSSTETAVNDNLQTLVYALLAAADLSFDNRLEVAESLAAPRLTQTDSGLMARITDGDGRVIWQSKSSLANDFARHIDLEPGQFRFTQTVSQNGERLFTVYYSILWQTEQGEELPFQFTVGEDFSFYQARVKSFRQTLWLWLFGSAAVLILVQLGVLWWGLMPLRRMAADVLEVENGKREQISKTYPTELKPLADNLNALLINERKQRQRYRDKLDDLAHSLKTPLTVLRHLAEENQPKSKISGEVSTQVDRMQDIVSYQLRSSVGAKTRFSLANSIKPEVEKITRTLNKAYFDKNVRLQVNVDSHAVFRGDPGDLIELLGNLVDNAFKHCKTEVTIDVTQDDRLRIAVEDDGPGIPQAERNTIMKRRVRADSRTEGQGIGLAVVAEIVQSYMGTIEILDAELGGARIEVIFEQ